MGSLPKPLIGLLLGTVAFFAIWTVALKPHPSSSGGSQGGVGQYQSAVNQAHGAVATSNQANAKLGAPTATVAAPKRSPQAHSAPAAKAAAPGKPGAAHKAATKTVHPASKTPPAVKDSVAKAAPSSPAEQVKTVDDAIRAGKVVAVLFYNGAAADDQAMKKELAAIPAHGDKVVKLAVPVSQLIQFAMITQQVPVVTAPTLVVIDAARQASTITGYAAPVEIAQRVSDALAAK